jgi:hypothetical protein
MSFRKHPSLHEYGEDLGFLGLGISHAVSKPEKLFINIFEQSATLYNTKTNTAMEVPFCTLYSIPLYSAMLTDAPFSPKLE